jgi:hypothetical protein
MDIIASNAFLAKAINNTFNNRLGLITCIYPRLNIILILNAYTLLYLILIS